MPKMTVLIQYDQNPGSHSVSEPTAVVVMQDGVIQPLKKTDEQDNQGPGNGTGAGNRPATLPNKKPFPQRGYQTQQNLMYIGTGSGCMWVGGRMYCW